MARHVDFDRMAEKLSKVQVTGFGSEQSDGLYAWCMDCQRIIVTTEAGVAYSNELLMVILDHDCDEEDGPVELAIDAEGLPTEGDGEEPPPRAVEELPAFEPFNDKFGSMDGYPIVPIKSYDPDPMPDPTKKVMETLMTEIYAHLSTEGDDRNAGR